MVSTPPNSEDELDFIDQTYDRAKKLVRVGIWGELDESRLTAWLDCFAKYQAQLLAAFLLDNLCYRSKRQFASMLDELMFQLESLEILSSAALSSSPSSSPSTRLTFSPVINDSSPPTKSGPYILRLLQRQYRIHSEWLSWPQNIAGMTDLDRVIFVDDFCGTGNQFVKFLKSIGLDPETVKKRDLKISYVVAAIHEKGEKKIAENYPTVQVVASERLTAVDAVLSDESLGRYEIDGFKEKIIGQYNAVIKAAQLPAAGKFSSGYGELGLAYGFSHATPNNTLPIFWFETANWVPLLER